MKLISSFDSCHPQTRHRCMALTIDLDIGLHTSKCTSSRRSLDLLFNFFKIDNLYPFLTTQLTHSKIEACEIELIPIETSFSTLIPLLD
jgi:hypothetical protein